MAWREFNRNPGSTILMLILAGVILILVGTGMKTYVNMADAKNLEQYRENERDLQKNILACSKAIFYSETDIGSNKIVNIIANSTNTNVESANDLFTKAKRYGRICDSSYSVEILNTSSVKHEGSMQPGETISQSIQVRENTDFPVYRGSSLWRNLIQALGSTFTTLGSILLTVLGIDRFLLTKIFQKIQNKES